VTGRPGIDIPDHRGRTGLDQAGRNLTMTRDGRIADGKTLLLQWAAIDGEVARREDERLGCRATAALPPRRILMTVSLASGGNRQVVLATGVARMLTTVVA
jgi:hypothetical protein